MATAPQKTGIKNADDLITLALAFELNVKITTETASAAVNHTIRITIPVPPVYTGTDQGRAIAANALTMTWSKRTTARARGLLANATLESPDSLRKVRTLLALDTAVRALSDDAARHARDTAAHPEDVVDAPHTLYMGDEPRRADIPAAQVRRIVAMRRRSGRPVNQHSDTGAIHIGNHSYVPAEHAAAPVARFHMRTVNGGTPERIPTSDAVREMSNAQMKPGRKAVRTASISRSHARIEYRDNRGIVELRPATSEESAMEPKPDAERYTPGDTVVVRPQVFDPKTRKYRILPEYAGTVVNWAGGHYNVHATKADEHGEGGVRQCHTRELRPNPLITGTLPDYADNKGVSDALSVLTAAGHTLASLGLHVSGANVDGAFLTPESDRAATGTRVSYLADGWSEESITSHRSTKRRTEDRTARNEALSAYADALSAAGWKVWHTESTNTRTRRTLHLVVWPPLTDEEKAANILGAGEKWIRHHFQPDKAEYLTVSRESALCLITENLRSGSKVYPSTEGGVKIEPTNSKSSYWLQPFPASA
ncbi:hypothetical protein ACPCVO_45270 [Streptomyces umbrinus]|uniref:hypothetical protein n=1 Tax=Streptomyces umbrinus TaxID=67370 RepID=UPI003C3083FF